MPQSLDNKDEADREGGGGPASAADARSVGDGRTGETGAAVKQVRASDDSSDDDNESSGEGIALNPS